MPGQSYSSRVIVLKKTKLGESDLILTFLSEDGSQMRAVAKGARKPQSPFSARLELFCVADVLCSSGRSLDIVKEVRLVAGNDALRCDLALSSAAAPALELLDRATQAGLRSPRLFAMTESFLGAVGRASQEAACTLCAAFLLKAFFLLGIRPELDACVCCGTEVSPSPDRPQALSLIEGGVVCSRCEGSVETLRADGRAVLWARYLLASTFADIADAGVGLGDAFSVLDLCQRWSRVHLGVRLKSLEFLFTCGLF